MSSVVIPGLVRQVYTEGSRYCADAPTLTKSVVKDADENESKQVDFEWFARGSLGHYDITAKGAVVVKDWVGAKPIFDLTKFHVKCSCPDGDRQASSTFSSKFEKLYVCKHAAAALESVLDMDAARSLVERAAAREAEHKKRLAKREKFLTDQRKAQDRKLPGVRERIMHGMSKKTDAEIIALVKESLNTVIGLAALSEIFFKLCQQKRQSNVVDARKNTTLRFHPT